MKIKLPIMSGTAQIEIELEDKSILKCSAFADEIRVVEVAIPKGAVANVIRCFPMENGKRVGDGLVLVDGNWIDPVVEAEKSKKSVATHFNEMLQYPGKITYRETPAAEVKKPVAAEVVKPKQEAKPKVKPVSHEEIAKEIKGTFPRSPQN